MKEGGEEGRGGGKKEEARGRRRVRGKATHMHARTPRRTHTILSVALAERHSTDRSLMPNGTERKENGGKIEFDFHARAFRLWAGGRGEGRGEGGEVRRGEQLVYGWVEAEEWEGKERGGKKGSRNAWS